MTDYREVLRLYDLGISKRDIARSGLCSRNTVTDIVQRAMASNISYKQAEEFSDRELSEILFPAMDKKPLYKMPNYEHVHRELARNGVTLTLLWMEYCDGCREISELPYKLTQFCKYYRDYCTTTKATMHIDRKPGETMEVDWAGKTMGIVDTDTGEIIPAYVFVAVLPYSGYAYVEANLSMNQEAWITAHVNAYNHFGGATKILVPDNLKTGVERNGRDETLINKTYQEMAEHYSVAVLPARVRAPKDKASVEGAVGIASTWIIAALRNRQFLSLPELNTAIKQKLNEFNEKPFQKKDGSRVSLFKEEKAYLNPLPAYQFELSVWKIATVQYNYHISYEFQNYSVPYEYIKQKVDLRITKNIVEVFYAGNRVCSHPRLYGRNGQYSTNDEHMPPNHQKFVSWNGARFKAWAAKIGKNTVSVVEYFLTSHKVEQQGYKACMALLKLADGYSVVRLENACGKALSYTPYPSYKSISTILKTGQDKICEETSAVIADNDNQYSFTRGAEYYKGGKS